MIKPYEIDIYLPEYNIGIECNPTATHNSSLPDPWGGDPKHNNYHQLKSKMCLDRGIRLIHVFGYDWMHKHDIIVSMIRNSLMQSDDKIYARKCNANLYVMLFPVYYFISFSYLKINIIKF